MLIRRSLLLLQLPRPFHITQRVCSPFLKARFYPSVPITYALYPFIASKNRNLINISLMLFRLFIRFRTAKRVSILLLRLLVNQTDLLRITNMGIPVYMFLYDDSGNIIKGGIDIQGREYSVEV